MSNSTLLASLLRSDPQFKMSWSRLGGLGQPSKMPGYSFSTSAKDCQTGGKLQKVKDSVCSECYALRGNYGFDVVQKAMEKRIVATKGEFFVLDMVYVLLSLGETWFRWHDSGDIQSAEHLLKIVEIAKRIPQINFWLPTKEFGYVSQVKRKIKKWPANLTIRLSGFKIGGPAPRKLARSLGVQVSSVERVKKKEVKNSIDKVENLCQSSAQGGICGDCRLCWNKEAFSVTYRKH